MRKYFKYLAVFTAVIMFNCEADDETKLSNYVGFEISPLYVEIPKNSSSTMEITFASSEKASSERTYSIYVDESSTLGTEYVVPSTVTIPANSNVGTFTISVSDDDSLAFFDQTLVISFQDEVGLDVSDSIVITATELCEETLINLNLVFDDYADEAIWRIYDMDATPPAILYTGGADAEYDGLESYDIRFCLEPGNYGIVVYDLYGDGGTDYTITTGDDVISSGSVPDIGSGYPAVSNISAEFTIE
ncbi:hypothetical protein DFQ11_104155 [Winogradskyella epiphytica]|uniref:Calx-beta domain-containing protein n=1 Tax=Winogradskyella epiphytica TaxID=262005 RepID=A0A2V4XYH3_9FLAO|nr:hypothetical protein [Winogradskyella epiphytica]PYE80788.1 hypothetical protein DFQ11_104155 [Winogradskyella epiphytica]GGW68432.1 hypothetical protein GCM10008085_20490 [Winogradskyella epiphytica]